MYSANRRRVIFYVRKWHRQREENEQMKKQITLILILINLLNRERRNIQVKSWFKGSDK